MVRRQIDHLPLALAKQEHPAVRVQVHDGGQRAAALLRDQHNGRDPKLGRGGEGNPLAVIIAAVNAIDQLRVCGGLILQQLKYLGTDTLLELREAVDSPDAARVRVVVVGGRLGNLGVQAPETHRFCLARRYHCNIFLIAEDSMFKENVITAMTGISVLLIALAMLVLPIAGIVDSVKSAEYGEKPVAVIGAWIVV